MEAEPNQKQEKLIDGIADYGVKWAKEDGQHDLPRIWKST